MALRYILVLCFLLSYNAVATPFHSMTAQEIFLDDFQRTTLSQASAIQPEVALTNSTVWFASKHAIWRWQLEKNKLHRIKFEHDHPNFIGFFNQKLVTATNAELFMISFKPQNTFRIPHPHYKNGKSLLLKAASSRLWWLHENGILALNKEASFVKKILDPISLSYDQIAFDPINQLVWLRLKNNLIMVDLKEQSLRKKLIHRAKFPLKGVVVSQGEVITYTENTLLRFSADQRLLQAIPVRKNRKLVAVSFNGDQHSYLFADGRLETYDESKRAAWYTEIKLTHTDKIEAFSTTDEFAVVLEGPTVRAFQLHKKPLKIARSEKKHAEM